MLIAARFTPLFPLAKSIRLFFLPNFGLVGIERKVVEQKLLM